MPSPAAPYLRDAGARESHDDGHDVDGQLELQELGDAVVDVAAPHHRLDDAGEVVVRQDDVRSLLRHVGACDALEGRGGSGRDEAQGELRALRLPGSTTLLLPQKQPQEDPAAARS